MSKAVEWLLQDHMEHTKEADYFPSCTSDFVATEPSYIKKLYVLMLVFWRRRKKDTGLGKTFENLISMAIPEKEMQPPIFIIPRIHRGY